MVVLQGKVFLGNLLETQDQGARLGIDPSFSGDKLGASSLILGVLKDALEVGVGGGALDGDGIAGLDKAADDGGGEGSVLEGLLLRTEEDGRVLRHDE
jgi:hypothetical protein